MVWALADGAQNEHIHAMLANFDCNVKNWRGNDEEDDESKKVADTSDVHSKRELAHIQIYMFADFSQTLPPLMYNSRVRKR